MGAIVATAALLGTFALFEGVAAIMGEVTGDPEADVQAALQRLQAKTQRRHATELAAEQASREDIDEQFAQFNQIPQRALSEASLLQQSSNPTPEDTGLMDYVTSRLGLPGHEFERLSSPSRMGDMSSIHRKLGNSLPSAPPAAGAAPPGGAPPA